MILKNPKECFCLQQRQTFFVLNELTAPECKDGSEPLTLHHRTFSRFKFVIINADKKATTSNIPASAIPEILETVKMKNLQKKSPKKVSKKNRKKRQNKQLFQHIKCEKVEVITI